jgi:autotransporter-associated beta strand protein
MLGTYNQLGTDLRCSLYTSSGTNAWNGPIVLGGSGLAGLWADAANAELDANGPVTGPAFTGKFTLRGTGGRGLLAGVVNLPSGQVNKTESSTWTITSTGNSWVSTDIAGGTLRMGGNNVFPASAFVNFTAAANLDLGGYNQQIAGLNGTNAASVIGSSSTASDSTLAINAAFPSTQWGVIQDSLSGGTRKVSLSLLGGSLTLTNVNTYSGDTTVSAGTLYLLGAGSIANSRTINLGAGATLDVSGRVDGGLTVGANQLLKGNGTFNIAGNLTNNGTIELKLNKSGSTLTSDRVQVSSQIAYGGTLKLDLSGDPLASGDTFQLFSASGYSGAFPTFVPSTPGPGLAWYSSTLAVDGNIRVLSVPIATGTTKIGTNMTVTGNHGPPSLTYVVISSLNATSPRDFWTPVATNSFDASGNYSFTVPIQRNTQKRFFSIWIP